MLTWTLLYTTAFLLDADRLTGFTGAATGATGSAPAVDVSAAVAVPACSTEPFEAFRRDPTDGVVFAGAVAPAGGRKDVAGWELMLLAAGFLLGPAVGESAMLSMGGVVVRCRSEAYTRPNE